ncbi:ferric iron uptake transcriptional regulator [SAR86 cluster bacterium]|jgi:Fur family ferric uptake transcriptional regulator|uniref:Ferric uptake regulation protein n=1 Tax=SAR86 cluster bacterium TaxID=2030880 RepID=A0A368BYL8_9GAMM|nr:MAG: ferric iron uptake transcriptional regulator [SAR86 cluster bacterium]URQ63373.1 ferric iron uptake transcriptional regulator [SAR86 cluster bacterium]URQ64431.1 ferric iron uptake transcriptional regulator [SAR86 cluster bacterium]|tara:strand:- start:2975 stop:3394 length:420 start_codon:yes stop_codon:yes gene_type:complete
MDDKTNKNLQEAGLKATLPRIKILEIMQRTAGTEDHYTAEDIYKELVMNSYDIGLATVYRVLTQFENAGMVVKHKFEENKAVYELNDPQHHDHMVCVETGAITEFHDETIKKKQREIAEKHGYDLLDQSVILYVRKKKN